MRIRWATLVVALAGLLLGAAPSANDPKVLYSAVVDQEIREIPFLVGSDAFVRDYGLLLLCHGKISTAQATAMIPKWRTEIRRRVSDQRDRYLTAVFQTPLLDYDKQQGGFPLPIVVADDSHDMMFSVQTDVGFAPPWHPCATPDFSRSVLPAHASLFVANTGVFSILPAPRAAAPRLRKAMGDAPSATIRAVVKLQSIDLRDNAAAALVQSYTASPGYSGSRSFAKWPKQGDSVNPLSCVLQRVWQTGANESADKRPYMHARITLRASRTITVRPDQFVLSVPFRNGGNQLVEGFDAAAPPQLTPDLIGSLLALTKDVKTKSLDAEIPMDSSKSVESDEDLGLSMATTLAPTSGGGYDWVVTFPLTPAVEYADRIDAVTWDYAFDAPCRPKDDNASEIKATP